MYFVTADRHGFDRKELAKNGFTDAILLPIDLTILRRLVSQSSMQFRDVSLIDISPDTVLEFDTYLYLPMNDKFIRFSSAGQKLEAARAQRLVNRNVSSVHISEDQLEAFYRFTAAQLKALAVDGATSATERRERTQVAIRSLLTGVLVKGSDIADCAEIVKTYIMSRDNEGGQLYRKILSLSGRSGDAYRHVSNVSTLAAMLAIGLGLENVEEIAMAGLLHDIGLADVPVEIQSKHESQRSILEKKQYERHPEFTVAILKARNVQLSDKVFQIIEQHHERKDGQGFPTGVREVIVEAQLIAMADEFDYLTQIKPGHPRPSPQVAMAEILSSSAYDLDLLEQITNLLGLEETSANKTVT